MGRNSKSQENRKDYKEKQHKIRAEPLKEKKIKFDHNLKEQVDQVIDFKQLLSEGLSLINPNDDKNLRKIIVKVRKNIKNNS